MKQPKKLTLQRAINATKKPMARRGDLVAVQFFAHLIGHSDFPNGEMRSPFLPSHDLSVIRFPQPKTENWLRELYAKGDWWLESAAHLSDREIALLTDGRGGVMRPSGLVGDWGDTHELEKDLQEAFALIPAGRIDLPVSPVVHNLIREIVLRLHKKYAPDAEIGRSQSEAQAKKASKERYAKGEGKQSLLDVICTLSREHPDSKPSEIWPHLRTALKEWTGCMVTEVESAKRDSCAYRYISPNAEGDNIRPISRGRFRKLLKEIRDGKNGN
jgi:hypothetical protein